VKSNFVTKWFEWQKLNKVASTYLGNIKREVEGEYLHPFFNLHTVKTYRGSADAPNFQNIPIRNPAMAEIIRSAFIARDGHVITENDFGGIEVRIGTCYHKDTMMIKYIKEGYDYHKEYAAKCYKLKPEDVTPAVRYCGKNMFVFPEFYGSYYADCCRNLWEACTKMKLTGPGGVPLRQHLQAQGIKGLGACEPKEKPRKGTFERHILETEDALWNLFHEYATWKDRWYRQYHQRGWFELKTGFVCHGLYSKNQSVNYPVQGAAFHCLLWVLIQLQKWLNKYKMKSKLVGQIHDSIIGDIHVKELDDYFAQVKYLVEVALPKHWPWIIVPMEIEAEMSSEGKSWFHKKKVQI
jgi:DNA polymerase I